MTGPSFLSRYQSNPNKRRELAGKQPFIAKLETRIPFQWRPLPHGLTVDRLFRLMKYPECVMRARRKIRFGRSLLSRSELVGASPIVIYAYFSFPHIAIIVCLLVRLCVQKWEFCCCKLERTVPSCQEASLWILRDRFSSCAEEGEEEEEKTFSNEVHGEIGGK